MGMAGMLAAGADAGRLGAAGGGEGKGSVGAGAAATEIEGAAAVGMGEMLGGATGGGTKLGLLGPGTGKLGAVPNAGVVVEATTSVCAVPTFLAVSITCKRKPTAPKLPDRKRT